MTKKEAITGFLDNENVASHLYNDQLAQEILEILGIDPNEKFEDEEWAKVLKPQKTSC